MQAHANVVVAVKRRHVNTQSEWTSGLMAGAAMCQGAPPLRAKLGSLRYGLRTHWQPLPVAQHLPPHTHTPHPHNRETLLTHGTEAATAMAPTQSGGGGVASPIAQTPFLSQIRANHGAINKAHGDGAGPGVPSAHLSIFLATQRPRRDTR